MSPAPDLPPAADPRTRWARVRALVEGALQRPEREREAFLVQQESDGTLRAEARELLAHQGQEMPEPPAVAGLGALGLATGEGAPAGDGGEAGVRGEEEDAPARLGPYRVLRRIGAGGMGTVHLAVRDDGQFEKRVALKLVKRGMDTEEVLRRFEQERRLLATLDHPGIARVIDGGMGPDGRPYLVMEHVEGAAIDLWCDRQALSVRERIELFCQVCDAVADAHRSLVVHRDIKPSNVLVTLEGRPKLLDFGIAKVLDARQGFATLDLTSTPLKLLTPAYASPEQVRGEPVTTASDVYSLGVLLYQLLTGRTPLRFETGSALEIERVVCRVEPERPSTVLARGARVAGEDGDSTREFAARRATTPRALRRALAGDLDTVVLKALRKEPRRRYASAAELALDLRRHLAGQPVEARADTFAYRASCFVLRNRAAVAAGALVLLSLVGGLLASITQHRRAEDARAALAVQLGIDRSRASDLERLAGDLESQRAEAERRLEEVRLLNLELDGQRALALSRLADMHEFATALVFDVHRDLVPVEGTAAARQHVVSLGLAFLERLTPQATGHPKILGALVGAYLRLAEIQLEEGGGEASGTEHALRSVARAVELGEERLAVSGGDSASRFSAGSAHLVQGELMAALEHRELARAALERALELVGPSVEDPVRRPPGLAYLFGSALAHLGRLRLAEQELDEAETLLAAAWRELEPLAGRLPRLRSALVKLGGDGARLAAARGRLAEAIVEQERALAGWDELLADEPEHPEWHRFRRAARLDLAGLLARAGRHPEAEGQVLAVLGELEPGLARAAPPLALRRERLRALRQLGRLDAAAGRRAEAHARTRLEVALARKLREDDPGPAARAELALSLIHASQAALSADLLEEAGSAALEAMRHLEALWAGGEASEKVHQGLILAGIALARTAEQRAGAAPGDAVRMAELSEARARYRSALGRMEERLPVDPWGAPDPSIRERALRGLARCEEALSAPPEPEPAPASAAPIPAGGPR